MSDLVEKLHAALAAANELGLTPEVFEAILEYVEDNSDAWAQMCVRSDFGC